MSTETIIDRYTNTEVEVYYLTDSAQFRDKGTIVECDGTWLTLYKPGGEVFLIPRSAVRLIKLLNPPKDKETLLLRPAQPDNEEEQRRLSSNL